MAFIIYNSVKKLSDTLKIFIRKLLSLHMLDICFVFCVFVFFGDHKQMQISFLFVVDEKK